MISVLSQQLGFVISSVVEASKGKIDVIDLLQGAMNLTAQTATEEGSGFRPYDSGRDL